MITVTRKVLSGSAWPLRTPSDMFDALTVLSEEGWTGDVTNNVGGWRLRLSKDGAQTVNAILGQWVVLDGDLRAIDRAAFPDTYNAEEEIVFPQDDEPTAPEPPAEDTSHVFGAETSPDTFVRITQ